MDICCKIQKLTLTGLEHEFVFSSLFDLSGSFSLFIIPVLHSEYLNILSKHKTASPLWFIFGPLNEESYEFIFSIQESQSVTHRWPLSYVHLRNMSILNFKSSFRRKVNSWMHTCEIPSFRDTLKLEGC